MNNRKQMSTTLQVSFIPIVVAFAVLCTARDQKKAAPTRTVVYVCEHGAARSVIAAAYFNKLAAERGLNVRAVARGVTPQPELSVAAVAGLQKDGIDFPKEKPKGLSEAELKEVERLVTFYPLANTPKNTPVDTFEVPAPSDGYDASRDAILAHVKALIDELQEQNK